MADGTSFFSRFTMKFVEVVGAGIATAVTGYLIAHLGLNGFWSSSASSPAAVQTTPSIGVVTKAARMPPTKPAAADTAALPYSGKPDVATAKEATSAKEPTPVKDAGPAALPAHATANAAPSAAARKPAAAEAHATESKAHEEAKKEEAKTKTEAKSRETESKPHEAESKPRDKEDSTASVEERVRAALAKLDASRPPSAEPVVAPMPAHQIVVPPPPVVTAPATAPAVVVVPPRSTEPSPAAVAVAPPADITPPSAQPKAPAPLDAVEIKSEPVASVDPSAPPPAPAKESAQADGGLFSTIKKIPEMLRPAAGATTSDPPRPPMPVGDNQ